MPEDLPARRKYTDSSRARVIGLVSQQSIELYKVSSKKISWMFFAVKMARPFIASVERLTTTT